MKDQEQSGWPWSVLGIDETTDEGKIKEAYAAGLRKARPDDEPEGFQQLRQARDLAMALARDPGEPQDPARPLGQPADRAGGPDDDARPETPNTGPEPVEHTGQDNQQTSLSERLDGFLTSPWTRSDPQRWRQFFEDLPILNSAQREELERTIVLELDAWLDGVKLPHPAVLTVLNEEFFWDASGSNLEEILDPVRRARIRTIISSLKLKPVTK